MATTRLDELITTLKGPGLYTHTAFRAAADAAIGELVSVVMKSRLTAGGEEAGFIPTREQARLMYWLEACRSKGYVVNRPAGGAVHADDDDEPVVRVSTASGKEYDAYPQDPYRTPPFTAPVHMPDGTIERWGPKRLRETGGMIGNSLLYGTRFGADLHYDPHTHRIREVEGPRFNHGAYAAWAQSH